MPEYSEQDLKYAAAFRDEIHREALAIVRKTHPNACEVIDLHPVEDYFQENWEYPGKWYTIVAIPYGYKSRQAFIDEIVRNTLSGELPEKELPYTQQLRGIGKPTNNLDKKPDGYKVTAKHKEAIYQLLAEYPDIVVDYCIVNCERYCGYQSHKKALKTAYGKICEGLNGDPDKATGESISTDKMFSAECENDKLNYKKAFLCPPYENGYTDRDFDRVNSALFPNGTDLLEIYKWSTDWSEYFDEGHEWWGTLCLTVYDKTLNRFVIIMASATD